MHLVSSERAGLDKEQKGPDFGHIDDCGVEVKIWYCAVSMHVCCDYCCFFLQHVHFHVACLTLLFFTRKYGRGLINILNCCTCQYILSFYKHFVTLFQFNAWFCIPSLEMLLMKLHWKTWFKISWGSFYFKHSCIIFSAHIPFQTKCCFLQEIYSGVGKNYVISL